MNTRTRRPALAAGILAAALAVAGCSSDAETEAAAPPSSPDSTTGSASPSPSPAGGPETEPQAAPTDRWEPHDDFRDIWGDRLSGPADTYEAVLELGYTPDGEGVIDLPGAADWVLAPNGEFWDVDMFYDLGVIVDSGEPAEPASDAGQVDCAENWDSLEFLLLRDGLEDPIYDEGPAAGPTCFQDPGGAPGGPEPRHVHYVCQTADTTGRVLVSDGSGGPTVWTPEHTTGNDRQCFGFNGAEIAVHEVAVVNS